MAVLRRKARKKINDSKKLYDVSSLMAFATEKNLNTVPISLRALIKELGLRLKIHIMDTEVSGYLKKTGDGEWVIGVNELHHPNRRRFTIAHELAHYCLHSEAMDCFEDTVLFRNGDSNEFEIEANQFAAELLMPESELLTYISHTSKNVDTIAEHFKVSSMAVRIRAKTLGLGGHGV